LYLYRNDVIRCVTKRFWDCTDDMYGPPARAVCTRMCTGVYGCAKNAPVQTARIQTFVRVVSIGLNLNSDMVTWQLHMEWGRMDK